MDKLSQEVSVIVVVSFFLLLVAVGIITLVLVYRRKQAEYVHEQKQLKAAFEKELLEAQLEIQEQTMKHIAQEVHDNVNQTLGLVKLNLNTIPKDKQNGIEEKISNTRELVIKAIEDLRNLSTTLDAEAVLSNGIEKAIETELNLISRTAVFETSFSVTGTPLLIDHQKELILFRTVQEALNNAIKHSGATRIEISLHYHIDSLQLTILDNGKGLDHIAVTNDLKKGSGLRNMQNRTKMIGAEFSIDGKSGTKIQISLPIIVA
ncbi:MAG: sensor histidine kinase [Chitinophagaceae bacterium]